MSGLTVFKEQKASPMSKPVAPALDEGPCVDDGLAEREPQELVDERRVVHAVEYQVLDAAQLTGDIHGSHHDALQVDGIPEARFDLPRGVDDNGHPPALQGVCRILQLSEVFLPLMEERSHDAGRLILGVIHFAPQGLSFDDRIDTHLDSVVAKPLVSLEKTAGHHVRVRRESLDCLPCNARRDMVHGREHGHPVDGLPPHRAENPFF